MGIAWSTVEHGEGFTPPVEFLDGCPHPLTSPALYMDERKESGIGYDQMDCLACFQNKNSHPLQWRRFLGIHRKPHSEVVTQFVCAARRAWESGNKDRIDRWLSHGRFSSDQAVTNCNVDTVIRRARQLWSGILLYFTSFYIRHPYQVDSHLRRQGF